jgi:fructokinase
MLLGGIEAGGTKFVCVVGTGPDDLRAELRVPTTSPRETLATALQFFQAQQDRHGRLDALGIGSFGPIDLDPASVRFGFITSTPKPGWANTDLVRVFREGLGVPVAFDTDVNAAALGEWRYGAARGRDTFLYLTVGTGIGGGALVNGRLLHGLVHPEMGHVRVAHDHGADPFAGACPFHGDCLEGLASGTAMAARWGRPAHELPADHPGWTLEAHYLAQALQGFVCTLSPQCVVMGGGVMDQPQLLARVRRELQTLLHGYIQAPELLRHIDGYVVPPALGRRAGALGALVLAERAKHRG